MTWVKLNCPYERVFIKPVAGYRDFLRKSPRLKDHIGGLRTNKLNYRELKKGGERRGN